MSTKVSPWTGLRRLLYLVSPNETSYGDVSSVPDYIAESYPFIYVALIVEFVVAVLTRHRALRLNDGVSSISAGILSQTPLMFFRSTEVIMYLYVYERWRLCDLDWQNPMSWWACFIGVDLAYYCLHRMGHELHFFWASHQVHHSSEDYNLTTALRQSVVQRYIAWTCYMPMAFIGLPPSLFVAHVQFNTLYQFWIHTELIGQLGPLEWIINTPSHHRVHHGRNRYCIDKNYGGTLIIWDRMFGTFAAERADDPVVYGLVHPLQTWDPISIQIHNFVYLIQRVWSIAGWRNKLSVILQGPGWDVGKPRLGLPEDIPDVHAPQTVYDTKPSAIWLNVYIVVHFALMLLAVNYLANFLQQMVPTMQLVLMNGFIVYTLTTVGLLLDCRKFAPLMELARCSLFLCVSGFYLQRFALTPAVNVSSTLGVAAQIAMEPPYVSHVTLRLLHYAFLASTLPWVLQLIGLVRTVKNDSKLD